MIGGCESTNPSESFRLRRGKVTPALPCWPTADGLCSGGTLGWGAETSSTTLDSVTKKHCFASSGQAEKHIFGWLLGTPVRCLFQ